MIVAVIIVYVILLIWAACDGGKPQEIVLGRRDLSKEEYVSTYFFFPFFFVLFVIRGLYRGLFPGRLR